MSRKGNCWDNAPAESFFKTLKAELRVDGKFTSYQQARQSIFKFIELWYNRKRLHSALTYRTPAQIEQLLTQDHASMNDLTYCPFFVAIPIKLHPQNGPSINALVTTNADTSLYWELWWS